jgi:phosphoribosylformylglycinamidine (FGAM) synthase PurS component
VTYKHGIFDPPGATADARSQPGLRGRDSVDRQIHPLEGDVDLATATEMCEKLLANPVIEDFRIETVEE